MENEKNQPQHNLSDFESDSADLHHQSRAGLAHRLDGARVGLTLLALLAGITILGVSGNALAVYNGTHLPGDFLLPLWPDQFNLRPTVALTTAAVRETVQGWAASIASGPATVPAPDSGSVCRLGASVVARSSVEGRRRSVSAVCPHLGGVVRWNDGELSWDCPVHGSRFAPDGSALEGPTIEDLRPRSPDPSASATSEPTAPGAGASRA